MIIFLYFKNVSKKTPLNCNLIVKFNLKTVIQSLLKCTRSSRNTSAVRFRKLFSFSVLIQESLHLLRRLGSFSFGVLFRVRTRKRLISFAVHRLVQTKPDHMWAPHVTFSVDLIVFVANFTILSERKKVLFLLCIYFCFHDQTILVHSKRRLNYVFKLVLGLEEKQRVKWFLITNFCLNNVLNVQ